MKKIILILLLSLGMTKAQAQTFTKYADTANYLIHQIENKKSLFVGKKFSVLLDSLKIQPVEYIVTYDGDTIDYGKRIIFDFNYEIGFEKTHFIIVHFNNVPSYHQLYPMVWLGGGEKASMLTLLNIFKNLIVTDVGVKNYRNDEPEDPDVQY